MTESNETRSSQKYLGIGVERTYSMSGKRRRVLTKEQDPHRVVRRVRINGYEGRAQDLLKGSSTSEWKENLLDGRKMSGVLTDDNLLTWFPIPPETSSEDAVTLVAARNPNARPTAKFSFGKSGEEGEVDLVIDSLEVAEDVYATNLLEYFGRSLAWQPDFRFEINYKDKARQPFKGSFADYKVPVDGK